jgi:hypothetical protein
MFNRHTTIAKKIPVALALLGVLAVTAVARPALASSVTGPLSQVEFNAAEPDYPQLLLQINGINYYAQQPAPGCRRPEALRR